MADTTIQVILGFPPGQIALNEIHYHPIDEQVEYLEFVNIGSDTLNINGWSFRDRSGARGTISSQIMIPADSLFLLCGDEAILSDWTPVNTPLVELIPWPSLNNTSDSILIFDPLGNQQLAHGYESTQGGAAGRSLERLALWKLADQAASWSTCEDPWGITPGRRNSVHVPPVNLVLGEIQILDSLLMINEDFFVQFEILNMGIEPVSTARVTVQVFNEMDKLVEYDELLPILTAGDTLLWSINLELDQCGWLDFVAEVHFPNDDLPEDNFLALRSYVSCFSSPLVINELMPVPLPDQLEWVELYNRSNRAVDLQNWLISDNSLAGKVISDSMLMLAARSYVLLTAQADLYPIIGEGHVQAISGFPTLNNTEDAVILFDPQSRRMDETFYDGFTAIAEGRSLERIRNDAPGSDPRNWGICIDELASTAGRENSLNLIELPPKLTINLNPNPFTPNGDGQTDELGIQYELPMEQGLMSVMIFDMAGRKIAEPVLAEAVSHRGQLTWDGSASYGGIAVTGLYICKVLVDNQQGKVTETLKKIYLVR